MVRAVGLDGEREAVVLGGIPNTAIYFSYHVNFCIYCNTGVYVACATFGSCGSPHTILKGFFRCAAFECPWHLVKSDLEKAN